METQFYIKEEPVDLYDDFSAEKQELEENQVAKGVAAVRTEYTVSNDGFEIVEEQQNVITLNAADNKSDDERYFIANLHNSGEFLNKLPNNGVEIEEICARCHRTFTSCSEYKAHLKQWSCDDDIAVYRCVVCPLTFSTKEERGVHIDLHRLNRFFCWQYCGLCFDTVEQCEEHENREHMFRNLSCSVCNCRFRAFDALKRHLRAAHGNMQRYVCSYCRLWFSTSPLLVAHWRAKPKSCGRLMDNTVPHTFTCKGIIGQYKLRAPTLKRSAPVAKPTPEICDGAKRVKQEMDDSNDMIRVKEEPIDDYEQFIDSYDDTTMHLMEPQLDIKVEEIEIKSEPQDWLTPETIVPETIAPIKTQPSDSFVFSGKSNFVNIKLLPSNTFKFTPMKMVKLPPNTKIIRLPTKSSPSLVKQPTPPLLTQSPPPMLTQTPAPLPKESLAPLPKLTPTALLKPSLGRPPKRSTERPPKRLPAPLQKLTPTSLLKPMPAPVPKKKRRPPTPPPKKKLPVKLTPTSQLKSAPAAAVPCKPSPNFNLTLTELERRLNARNIVLNRLKNATTITTPLAAFMPPRAPTLPPTAINDEVGDAITTDMIDIIESDEESMRRKLLLSKSAIQNIDVIPAKRELINILKEKVAEAAKGKRRLAESGTTEDDNSLATQIILSSSTHAKAAPTLDATEAADDITVTCPDTLPSIFLMLRDGIDAELMKLRRHYPEFRFFWLCPRCTRQYELKYTFRKHLLRAHNISLADSDNMLCEVYPQKTVPVPIAVPLAAKSASQTFKTTPMTQTAPRHICRRCGRICSSQTMLYDHMRGNCSRVPLYPCSVCNKKFYSAGTLSCHSTIHTGELPYSCNYCKKQFRTRGQVTVHHRTHTGERPFVCEVCQQGFTHRETLISHLSRHIGMKRYKCYGCNLHFSCISGLRTHRDIRPDTCGKVKLNTRAVGPRVRVIRGNVMFEPQPEINPYLRTEDPQEVLAEIQNHQNNANDVEVLETITI